jgi:acetyl esterase/lipase
MAVRSERRRSLRFVVVCLLPSLLAAQAEPLVFATRDGHELRIELAVPAGDGPHPVVLMVPGGAAWSGERAELRDALRRAVAHALAAAAADYRIAPASRWPSPRDDVRTAIDWLGEHAREHRLDRHRIAVAGAATGGHLALAAAFAPGDEAAGTRSPLAAVVNLGGPTDLRARDRLSPALAVALDDLLGTERGRAVPADLSPLALCRVVAPMVLSVHTEDDALVPLDHARVLHRELARLAVPNRLVVREREADDAWREAFAWLRELLAGSARPLAFHDDFECDLDAWQPLGDAAAWHLAGTPGRPRLALARRPAYTPEVRSPHGIALLRAPAVADFVLDVDARSTTAEYGHRDLCVVFGFQDPTHFYYVHLATRADQHAHSVFVVDGAPRRSMSSVRTNGVAWDDGWHRLRVRREADRIEVFFDDLTVPVMTAVDGTFGRGRVGLGSFDDTGEFAAFRLR